MNNMKQLREFRKMTQSDLGDKTGYTVSSISRFESGSRRLKQEQILRFSKALGCTVDELLGTAENYMAATQDKIRVIADLGENLWSVPSHDIPVREYLPVVPGGTYKDVSHEAYQVYDDHASPAFTRGSYVITVPFSLSTSQLTNMSKVIVRSTNGAMRRLAVGTVVTHPIQAPSVDISGKVHELGEEHKVIALIAASYDQIIK